MRVLVTGASGLLGSYLLKTASKRDTVRGCYSSQGGPPLVKLDVLDRKSVAQVLQTFHPEIVIHCAGDGRVDFSERHPFEARALNLEGTKTLMAEAARLGCDFVYISTNAVFDGENAPYFEDSPKNPVNEYGRIKLEAEMAVAHYPFQHIIVRPILLYGWPPVGRRGNFVTRILDSLRKGEPVTVDQRIVTQPTYAWDCAEAIWAILRKRVGVNAVVNVAPVGKAYLYRFAIEVARAWGLPESLIHPIPDGALEGLARRPRDTTFALEKLSDMGITLRAAPEGLAAMKAEAP